MIVLQDKRKNLRMTIGLLVGIAAALAAALKVSGCGWCYYHTDHSVRFNGYRNATQFARLPRLPDFSRLDQNRLLAVGEDVGYAEENYEEYERKKDEIDELWDKAEELQGNGGLVEERKK